MEKINSLEEKISALKSHFLAVHPFYGTIIVNLSYVIDETHFPAATDCYKTIYIHPDADKLSNYTFKFVNLHELLHVVFMHSQRKGSRNHFLWCIACDYAVNSVLIDEMKMEPPEELPCLYDKRFSGLPAEKIYELLLEELREKGEIKLCFSGNAEGGVKIRISENTGLDEFPIDEKTLAPGDIKESKNPADEQERIRDIIIQAHIVYQKLKDKTRGDLPGSVVEYIKQIIKPDIPFERLLVRYASEIISGKGEYTFNPVNKKYAFYYDLVMPSVAKEEVSKVVVAVDSSGSMKTHELQLAAGAIKRLASLTPEITVIVCDAQIQQVIRTTEIETFLRDIKFKGRGGTSHIPVFEYIDRNIKHPDVVICITDGYSEYPTKKPRYPVIWLLTENHREPPWGQKVIIKEKDRYRE